MSKVKRSAVWLIGMLFLIVLLAAGVAQAKMIEVNGKKYDIAQPGEFKPGEIVVKLHPGTSKDLMEGLESLMQGKVKAHIPEYDLYLLALPPAAGKAAQKAQADEAVKALKRHPQVKEAFPNTKFSIPKPPESPALAKGKKTDARVPGAAAPQALPAVEGATAAGLSAYQWHLDKIKFPNSGAAPTSTPMVAVVDTGVDYTHPDLAANVVKGYDYVEDDDDPMDEAGHGTHVAGLIAANSASGASGVSPTTKILAVRVLDAYGSGTSFQVMQGINFARNSNAKIINLSLGGYALEGSGAYNTFQTLVDDCFLEGKIVCVAAGNEDNAVTYSDMHDFPPPNYVPIPAWFPSSFTVGASEENDCRAYFSNYDVGTLGGVDYNFNFVDIVAPGWNVLSTIPVTQGVYARYSGTSMAAPIVAGCAARVWKKYPGYTPAQVQNRLITTGLPVGSATGANGFYTVERRVDLMKALGLNATGFCGVVYSGQTGAPLDGVKVVATPSGATVFTNPSGFFTMVGLAGATSYKLVFTKAGHGSWTVANQAAVANKIKDLVLPNHMNKARPTGQWTCLFSHRTWHPGYDDAFYSYFRDWWPVPWASTYGLAFAPRVVQDGSIIAAPGWGSLVEPPYAAITNDGWLYTSGCLNLVISQVAGGSTYRIWTRLDNDNDSYWEWGSYKGAGQGLRARIYNGGAIKGQAVAASAAGSGPYWWVADLVGDTLTIQNKFGNSPPPF